MVYGDFDGEESSLHVVKGQQDTMSQQNDKEIGKGSDNHYSSLNNISKILATPPNCSLSATARKKNDVVGQQDIMRQQNNKEIGKGSDNHDSTLNNSTTRHINDVVEESLANKVLYNMDSNSNATLHGPTIHEGTDKSPQINVESNTQMPIIDSTQKSQETNKFFSVDRKESVDVNSKNSTSTKQWVTKTFSQQVEAQTQANMMYVMESTKQNDTWNSHDTLQIGQEQNLVKQTPAGILQPIQPEDAVLNSKASTTNPKWVDMVDEKETDAVHKEIRTEENNVAVVEAVLNTDAPPFVPQQYVSSSIFFPPEFYSYQTGAAKAVQPLKYKQKKKERLPLDPTRRQPPRSSGSR